MKKTKLLTSLMALALVLGLGACEETGDDTTSEDSETSSETETSGSTTEGGEGETTEDNTDESSEGDNTDSSTDNPGSTDPTNRELLLEILSDTETLLGVNWSAFHYYDGTEGGVGDDSNYEEGYLTTDTNDSLYGYIDSIDDDEESHTYYLDGMAFFDNDGTKTYEEVQTKTFDGLLKAQLDSAYTQVTTLTTILENINDDAVTKSLNNYTVTCDYADSDSAGGTSSTTTYQINVTSKGILSLLTMEKNEEDVYDVGGTPTTFTTTTKYILETISASTIVVPSISKSEFGYREFMATLSSEDSHYHVYDDGTVELHQVVMDDGDTTNYGHCTKCGQTDLYTGALSYANAGDGTYYVNKYTGGSYSVEDELYIVSEYDGCPVTQIGDPSNTSGSSGAFYMSSLTFIGVPNTITRFNCGSFYSCTKLTSIYLPDGLTYIDNYAIANCSALAGDIVIPEGVTYIGNSAFLSDKLVTSITFTSNENLLQIGEQTFSSCTGLTTMTIPDSVTTIGEEIFKDCTNLESVNFPASMDTTPVGYLWGCTAISSVTLPESITKIGKSTFRNCTSLTSLDFLPEGIIEFGDNAFYGCTGITSFDWSKYTSLTTAGEYVFASSGLTEIEVPDYVTSIGERIFYDCSSLVSATLGKGITAIPAYCFRDDSALKTVTIPNTIKSVGGYAFNNCSALETVNFDGTEDEWTALLSTAQTSGNNAPLLSESLTVNYTNSN